MPIQPLLTNGGIIESVGDFEPKCKFTIVNSIDYFTVDADKSHGRVDAQGALVDEKGRSARVMIDGVIKLNEDNLPLVYNQPDARSSPWDHGSEYSLPLLPPTPYPPHHHHHHP